MNRTNYQKELDRIIENILVHGLVKKQKEILSKIYM